MDFRILGPLEVREGERRSRWGAASSAPCSPFSSSIAIKRSRPTGSPTSSGASGRRRRPRRSSRTTSSCAEPRERRSAGADLVTRGRGYLLRVEPGKLDLDAFQQLVEAGERALGRGSGRGSRDAA